MPCLLLLLAVPARAQQRGTGPKEPHIGYVFPAGLRIGTAAEVTVGGEFLDGTKDCLVSGSGIRVEPLRFNRPLTMKRQKELREYLDEARKKLTTSGTAAAPGRRWGNQGFITRSLTEAGASEEEIAKFLKMRKDRTDPKKQTNPQLSESMTFKVEVDPTAAPGPREIRLTTANGASNPLSFCVGRLPEQVLDKQLTEKQEEPPPNVTPTVVLPAVLNGQILPGQVDHYQFHATRGVRLVIAVQARDLIPYLADAVPGWFQPVVALYDSKGIEMAYAANYKFSPDPIFSYNVPETGDYHLEIRDALYRGREDFVYRITVGEVPFITSIFPMGGHPGVPTNVEVTGWNMTRQKAIVKPSAGEGIYPVPELSNGLVIGDVPFARDALPEVMEKEPNGDIGSAQKVPFPVIVNGRIDKPGDVDVYAISCAMGQRVVAEVTARRLGSPLDSYLRITNAAGRQLAFNDDYEDTSAALITHKADSYLLFTASAAGVYYVHVADAQRHGGDDYRYRLRISSPQPDFVLRMAPSAINGKPGEVVPVTFFATRKDGFSAEIKLVVEKNSGKVTLNGGVIPAGQDKVRATLLFPTDPPHKPFTISITGHATEDGRALSHPATPADDMLQAFLIHHVVPAKEALVVVTGSGRGGRPAATITSHLPVVIPIGGTSRVVLAYPGRGPLAADTQMKFTISDPPEGISIASTAPSPGGVALVIKADPAKAKLGLRGNLIIGTEMEQTVPAANGKAATTHRWPVGYLPAIPFEVGMR